MRISDWSSDVCSSDLARLPPTTIPRKIRMKTPRVGSVAKACTEFSTPERTRKVPSRLSEKVRMASSTVQLFRVSRFSTTMAECSRSEEHTSELQSLMRISYAVFCLQKKKHITDQTSHVTYE